MTMTMIRIQEGKVDLTLSLCLSAGKLSTSYIFYKVERGERGWWLVPACPAKRWWNGRRKIMGKKKEKIYKVK
jgi:hypothetical protein